MDQKLNQCQTTSDKCKICAHSIKNHSKDCLLTELKEYQQKQLYIPCPKCHNKSVDLNIYNYYECRECHTQFVAGFPIEDEELESDEQVILMNIKNNEIIFAYALKNKGDGKFIYDDHIADLQKKIDAIIPK